MIWIWQPIYLGTLAVTFVISIMVSHRHVPSVRALTFLLGYALVSETSGYWLKSTGINNQFLFYLYNPIEYLFLANLYAHHFSNHRIGLLTGLSGWLFLGFGVVYMALNAYQLHVAPTFMMLTEWILVIGLVLYYFYDIYKNDYFSSLTRQPIFWISVGNFLFYSGTFFQMGLIEEIKKTDLDLGKKLYLINTFLNIILYTLWSIGFLCPRRTSRISS